jgi:hypothetical protein
MSGWTSEIRARFSALSHVAQPLRLRLRAHATVSALGKTRRTMVGLDAGGQSRSERVAAKCARRRRMTPPAINQGT